MSNDVEALKKKLEDTLRLCMQEPVRRANLLTILQKDLDLLKQKVGEQDKSYQSFYHRVERQRQREREQQQQSRTAVQPASPQPTPAPSQPAAQSVSRQVPSAQPQPAVPSEQQTNATAGRPSDMGKPESPASGEASPGMPGQPAAAAAGETSASSSHTDAPGGIDTPPAITEGADGSATTSPPAAPDPQAPPFEQALAQLRQFQRYAIGEKLQEGNFSIGYRATDRQSGAAVVIKLPGPATWNARFAEAAGALSSESNILKEVNQLVPPEGAPDCARVVQHIEDGQLEVANWEPLVPYSIQSFARGTRLSDAEEKLLPFQGSREPEGVRLLHQLTGLLQRLYAAHLVHNDLKPDALFWDAAVHQVEVIDWNSALRTADPQARSKEFTFNLQRLISELFLNMQSIEHAQGVAFALFATHQGRHLSRGVRLLLARLLDPAFQANRLADVAALHTAVGELAADWEAAYDPASPQMQTDDPARLSRQLTRQALTLPVPAHQSNNVVWREAWYDQALTQAETYVAGNLSAWVAYPESMRAGMKRIERIWHWLPDVWPLLWVVPLARAWFATSETTRHDQGLAVLVQALVQRNWPALLQQLNQLDRREHDDLAVWLGQVQTLATAYQTLAQAEQSLGNASPNYAQIRSLLVQAQATLPLERRVTLLEREIGQRQELETEIEHLQAELDREQQQPPGVATQRRRLHLLQTLQQYQAVSGKTVAVQQQRVERIGQAAAVYDTAQTHGQAGRWAEVLALVPWQQDATLQEHAPDLVAQIKALVQQAVAHQFTQYHAQVRQALATGELEAALTAARAADNYAEQQGLPSATRTAARQLTEGLEQLQVRYQQALAGQYAAAAAIPAPDPAAVPPEVWRFHQELAAVIQSGQRLAAAAENAQALYEVWQTARQRIQAATHAPLRPLWEALARQAGQILPGAVTAEVRSASAAGESLPHPPDWYARMIGDLEQQQGAQVDLQYARSLLENYIATQQRHERDAHLQALTNKITHLQEYITAVDQKYTAWGNNLVTIPPRKWARNAEEKLKLLPVQQPVTSDGVTIRQAGKQPDISATSTAEQAGKQPGTPATSTPKQAGKQPDISATPTQPSAEKAAPEPRFLANPWVLWGVVAVVVLLFIVGGGWMAISNGLSPAHWFGGGVATSTPAPETATAIAANAVTQTAAAAAGAEAPVAADPNGEDAAENGSDPEPEAYPGPTPNPTAAEPSPPDNSGTVTVTPTLLVAAAQPLTLTAASGLEAVATVTLMVLEQRVPLTITRQLTDSLLLELPPNPLAGLEITTPVTLPLTTTLAPGAPFDPLPLTLGDPGLEVTVRGDPDLAEDGNFFFSDATQQSSVTGYYLWQTPDVNRRSADAADGDTVRVAEPEGYVLIQPGDRLQILAIQEDHYRVQVVSNQADNDAGYVLGQEGWLLRRIVDGV